MAPKKLPDQAYLRQCFDYGPETGLLTWKERPVAHFSSPARCKQANTRFAGKIARTVAKVASGPYRKVGIACDLFLQHRIVWKMLTGDEPAQIDHIDGDGLNNRIGNLRASDALTNHRNVKRHADHPYPKGVYRNHKRWRSHIMVAGVLHYLGTFDTQEEAHAAYCEAATRLHGEFANFGHDAPARQETPCAPSTK